MPHLCSDDRMRGTLVNTGSIQTALLQGRGRLNGALHTETQAPEMSDRVHRLPSVLAGADPAADHAAARGRSSLRAARRRSDCDPRILCSSHTRLAAKALVIPLLLGGGCCCCSCCALCAVWLPSARIAVGHPMLVPVASQSASLSIRRSVTDGCRRSDATAPSAVSTQDGRPCAGLAASSVARSVSAAESATGVEQSGGGEARGSRCWAAPTVVRLGREPKTLRCDASLGRVHECTVIESGPAVHSP